MSNDTTQHTPADVRERVAMEVYVWEHVRRGAEESWARQRWQTETDGMRDLYFEAADRILALLRTPRGEGEGDALGMLQASVDEYLWEAQNNPQFDAEAAFAALSREIRAARRSEAQEDRWEDVVFGPITAAYNEAHAARRGEGGDNGLE